MASLTQQFTPLFSNGRPAATSAVDNVSGATVPLEAVGLVNNAGTFDRLREFVSGGQMWVAEPTMQTLMSSMIVTLRALLAAHTVTNNLIGGSSQKFQPDLIAFADLITAATPGSPAGPNTLQ